MFRRVVSIVASSAMLALALPLLGPPSAAAAASPACVTRAAFIKDFDLAASISPVFPTTPDFSDVAHSSPYYGYVEAAYQAGIIVGTGGGKFSPGGCLTRAQIAKIEVLALGQGAAAQKDATSKTQFTDDQSISAWARGYVVEAIALGLIHGFPDGSFRPGNHLTASDEAHFLAQFKTVAATAGFRVSASASDVAVGQQVTLSTVGAGANVRFSTTQGALISGATFVASAPGNYTVTATTAAGATATVVISVYGAPAALKINVPSPIVANGASQETVTVDVVDKSGNIVANSTDSISLVDATRAALTGAPLPQAAVGGVASFTFTAGVIPGATDSLTATDAAAGLTASASATSVAQKATSIAVTAPAYLAVNTGAAAHTTFTAEVDDQTGHPMLVGTLGLTASVSGADASLDAAGAQTATGAYERGADATFTLYGAQSVTGPIAITVSGTGLTAGTATVQAVIVGTPSETVLSAPQTTSFSQDQGSTGLTYSYYVADASGYPAPSNEQLTFTVANSAGVVDQTSASSAAANNFAVSVTGNGAGDSGTITIQDAPGSGLGNAGAYTLQVTDQGALGLSASPTDTFHVTSGAVSQLALSAPTYISAASPTATLSAQLEDQSGNPVAESGVTVDFQATGAGASSVSVPASAVTNAQGVASVQASVPPYTGDTYTVQAQSAGAGTASASFQVESTIGSGVSVSLKDIAQGPDSQGHYQGSAAQATSSDTVQVTIEVQDTYGSDPGTQDALSISFGGAGTLGAGALLTGTSASLPAGGPWTVTTDPSATVGAQTVDAAVIDAPAALAGALTVTAQDTSTPVQPTGTASLAVSPGTITGATLYYEGTPVSAQNQVPAQADTPVALTLTPTDAAGNPGVEAAAATVELQDPSGGVFRLTPGGTSVTSVTLPAGSSGITLYYVNAAAGSYGPFGSAPPHATTVVVTGVPASTTAGTSFPLTLQLLDQLGQPFPYTGSDQIKVVLGTADTNGGTTLPTTASFTAGTATVDVTLATAQANSVSVDDTTLSATSGSSAVTVTPAAPSGGASTLAVPSPVIAGQAATYTLTLEDAYGNPITGLGSSAFQVKAALGTPSLGSITEVGTSDQYTFTVTDTTAEQIQVAVTAKDKLGTATVTSSTVLVDPAVADVNSAGAHHSTLSAGTTSATAVQSVTYTLVAQDQYGNPITGLTKGDVALSAVNQTGGPALLMVNSFKETATPGTYSIGVQDTSTGTYTLAATITDTAGKSASLDSSNAVTVTAGALSIWSVYWTSTTVTIRASDEYGNMVTSQSTAYVERLDADSDGNDEVAPAFTFGGTTVGLVVTKITLTNGKATLGWTGATDTDNDGPETFTIGIQVSSDSAQTASDTTSVFHTY